MISKALFNLKIKNICNPTSMSFHSLVGRNFLTLKDFSKEEIFQFLWTAADLKQSYKYKNQCNFKPLSGMSVALLFQKLSTRTRISSETGAALMGAHPCFLSPSDIHLGTNETLEDTAKVLSGFVNLVIARVYDHSVLDTLATHATVPIINGLSESFHPLQLLADLLTLQEQFCRLHGLNVAWIGDGNNNVTHSYMIACGTLGLNLKIASPKGYQPQPDITAHAKELFERNNATLTITTDPIEAASMSDVIVTDTFISMGREEDKVQRLKDFQGYQVDKNLVSRASSKWCFLHCLPRKEHEVTDDVFYDHQRSFVWHAAENRKWTVMAVMLNILKDFTPHIAMPKFE